MLSVCESALLAARLWKNTDILPHVVRMNFEAMLLLVKQRQRAARCPEFDAAILDRDVDRDSLVGVTTQMR
jgi:hypothetical protein